MSCSICLNETNQLLKWHEAINDLESAHDSCIQCVSQEIFRKIQLNQPITCPLCRKICIIEPTQEKNRSSYTLLNSSILISSYFFSRIIISNITSDLTTFFQKNIVEYDTSQWLHYNPFLETFGFYDVRSMQIRQLMTSHIQDGKRDVITAYLTQYLEKKHTACTTAFFTLNVLNLFFLNKAVSCFSQTRGIIELCCHFTITLVVMTYFKHDLHDIFSDNDGSFDVTLFPAINPSRVSKNLHELLYVSMISLLVTVIKISQYFSEEKRKKIKAEQLNNVEDLTFLFKKRWIKLTGISPLVAI